MIITLVTLLICISYVTAAKKFSSQNISNVIESASQPNSFTAPAAPSSVDPLKFPLVDSSVVSNNKPGESQFFHSPSELLASNNMELFAVVGGSNCAESLSYGPLSVSAAAVWGYPYFVSTLSAKGVAHNDWLQVVTSDGTTELFRVYWTFSAARTLADHFMLAARDGQSVSYRVVEASTATEYTYNGVWRYSSASGITSAQFDRTSVSNSFSASDGVWGAGNGELDGHNNPTGYTAHSFWGVGNWGGSDSQCSRIYMNGVASAHGGAAAKTFMYFSNLPVPTLGPTPVPTMAPTARPPSISMQVQQVSLQFYFRIHAIAHC